MSDAITGEWFVTYDDGVVRKSMRFHADGSKIDVKIETYGAEALKEQAAMDRSANAGKRWGEGQVIGRLPLPLYFSSGMAEARQQKDDAWIKRFWNNAEHKYLRTFEGDV